MQFFLTDNFITTDILEPIALWICEYLGIYGGKESVCWGGIVSMAPALLTSLAHGILSP
jgi:hypothetical protein